MQLTQLFNSFINGKFIKRFLTLKYVWKTASSAAASFFYTKMEEDCVWSGWDILYLMTIRVDIFVSLPEIRAVFKTQFTMKIFTEYNILKTLADIKC